MNERLMKRVTKELMPVEFATKSDRQAYEQFLKEKATGKLVSLIEHRSKVCDY